MAWFIWVFPNAWGRSLPAGADAANTWLVLAFFLSIVLTEIVFLAHCLLSKHLTGQAKILWLFALLLLSFLSLPVFWFVVIRNHTKVRATPA